MSTVQIRDVMANGVRLRVHEAGAGPVLLLLHDVFFDHSTWEALLEQLSTEYRVVVPDLPGFGMSERPSSRRFAYDVPAFVETLVGLYAGLGLGLTTLVGHGLGAAIAMSLAASHAPLVQRLVLINAQYLPAQRDPARSVARLPFAGAVLFKQVLGKVMFRSYFQQRLSGERGTVSHSRWEHYWEHFSEPAARAAALATLQATLDTRPLVAMIGRVRAPALVLWGRADRVYPAGIGQRLARDLRARFELLNTGHCPQEDCPEDVARAIVRFLSSEAAPSSRRTTAPPPSA